MTKLTPIKLDNNTTIYVETNEDIDITTDDKNIPQEIREETRESLGKSPKGINNLFSRTSPTESNLSEQEQIDNNIPSIANTIKSYTEYTLNAFKQVDNANIDKVTLEFGIKVMGKIGVPYVTTSADSHLKITVECSFIDPE
ncbi:CU044_2847 family protein [Crocosphaera sp. Alani8]|uniref:CU044_2847 family protein n=1 Tax=Crocosphaera sp. Alani8 TaxID=3038952 RepID=UPI00313E9967